MKRLFLYFLCITIIFLFSCKKNDEENRMINFYYWKQNFNLNNTQESIIKINKSDKIYCKYFDVVNQNGTAIPISKIQFDTIPSLPIVPCVFIKNNVFLLNNIDKLHLQIFDLIFQINKLHNIQINEIQFDCDWTPKTRDKYFNFLNQIKQKYGEKIIISSTIRLHEYKYYHQTGVPPVDKVILMCYNMGDIMDVKEKNSIISLDILKQYVKREVKYPIKINIALPIYKWGLVYRLNELAFIINNIDEEKVRNYKWNKKDIDIYESNDNFYYENHYIYAGDILRIERSNPKEINNSLIYINKQGIEFSELIFYHLSHNQIEEYSNEFFENIHNIIFN